MVASYRDPIGGGETFGYNNDFIAYFPLVEERGHQEGLLWVNHEYPDPFFIHGNPNPETKTASQIELEQYAVGGAVIRVVRRGDGPWELKRDRRYARRITATSPRIRLTGAGVGDPGNPAVWAPVPDHTYGSLANCAGGITPWGTALSAEENWDDYAEDYGWGPDFAAVNNGGYGWVLEVDPMDPAGSRASTPTSGRSGPENATVWAREGRHLVVYVGDDARDKFLYKYVSDGRYHKAQRPPELAAVHRRPAVGGRVRPGQPGRDGAVGHRALAQGRDDRRRPWSTRTPGCGPSPGSTRPPSSSTGPRTPRSTRSTTRSTRP